MMSGRKLVTLFGSAVSAFTGAASRSGLLLIGGLLIALVLIIGAVMWIIADEDRAECFNIVARGRRPAREPSDPGPANRVSASAAPSTDRDSDLSAVPHKNAHRRSGRTKTEDG